MLKEGYAVKAKQIKTNSGVNAQALGVRRLKGVTTGGGAVTRRMWEGVLQVPEAECSKGS